MFKMIFYMFIGVMVVLFASQNLEIVRLYIFTGAEIQVPLIMVIFISFFFRVSDRDYWGHPEGVSAQQTQEQQHGRSTTQCTLMMNLETKNRYFRTSPCLKRGARWAGGRG